MIDKQDTMKPQYLTLVCGPGSGDSTKYWIRDISSGQLIATGVPEEYALLMVTATNENFGDPELLKEKS